MCNLRVTLTGPQELLPSLEACRAATAAARTCLEAGTELEGTAGRATAVERALIAALDARYSSAASMADQAERDGSDRRYADAMRVALSLAPDDDDVIALTAEALITRTPWELWDTVTGTPTPGADTIEAAALLERGLSTAAAEGRPPHPGMDGCVASYIDGPLPSCANPACIKPLSSVYRALIFLLCLCWCVSTGQCHMYIHTMEMSPHPDAALEAAHALRGFAPDSGHLNHMPGHIFTLCGPFFPALPVWRWRRVQKRRVYNHVDNLVLRTSGVTLGC
eukprot:COSAG06_NODE_3755_length_4940_cov_31.669283_4_plen_280_part_00